MSLIRSERKRKMRRTIQSLTLVAALSASVYAGDMQFPVTSSPPPRSESVAQAPTADGEMQNGQADSSLTETILNLLEGVLSLF